MELQARLHLLSISRRSSIEARLPSACSDANAVHKRGVYLTQSARVSLPRARVRACHACQWVLCCVLCKSLLISIGR